MKKTFIIKESNKNSDRLVENAKHQIRKYIKREKKKTLPEGAYYWHFDCKFAKEGCELETIEFEDISKHIDNCVSSDNSRFEIELIARASGKNIKS